MVVSACRISGSKLSGWNFFTGVSISCKDVLFAVLL